MSRFDPLSVTSCKLNLDFEDPEYPELAKHAKLAELNNNNLHIWELGVILEFMPDYKILAPTEIVNANKGKTTTSDPTQASIIAALNGPMAHIYVKGMNGWDGDPDQDLLLKVADLLQAALAEGDGPIPNLSSSLDAILIRATRNSDYTVFYRNQNSPPYVNETIRITGMNHPDRSGDIILITKDSTSGDVSDRYTTGVACKAWHGSLNPSDSYVPFIVAYPGGNKSELTSFINNTQGCSVTQGCDGNWRVTDLIMQILKTQYTE